LPNIIVVIARLGTLDKEGPLRHGAQTTSTSNIYEARGRIFRVGVNWVFQFLLLCRSTTKTLLSKDDGVFMPSFFHSARKPLNNLNCRCGTFSQPLQCQDFLQLLRMLLALCQHFMQTAFSSFLSI
jgi:hypothetical protein